ncbi:MAG TPA: DUF6328 family protein [Candidatus Paceibacterota bacterium]|jgi:hypothetical protein
MSEDTSLKDRIDLVLEEIRVVVPGSQALLGFQLVALFSNGFLLLPQGLREVHLASLGLIALATILLMAPSAYHRIACRGENSPAVHRFASRMLIGAMFFLISGLAADIWVATYLVLGTNSAAWLAGGTCFVLALLLWFVYPAILARKRTG